MDEVECVVVGAGVVGLAIARALAMQGKEVLALEAAPIIGSETSARNSEVIHAGIYYAKDSLKARLCLVGRDALYDFCAGHGVPHARLGKLIVASAPAQLGQLDAIAVRAAANGVDDLKFLDATEIGKLEPALKASGGLLSPSTGIIDSHAFMLALQGDAENAGALFAFRTPVLRGEIVPDGYRLETGGDMPMQLKTRYLVNAAGHGAWDLARQLRGYPAHLIPKQALAKGNYFTLQGRSPFQRLIYPVPEPGGLGVHLTIDLGGQAKFGPDVQWVDAIDYAVDASRSERFYPAIRRYWPALPDGALAPSYSGIRPKIVPPAVAKQDFLIQGPQDHGVSGLINLFGIESPGLTSSLAIADEAARLAAV